MKSLKTAGLVIAILLVSLSLASADGEDEGKKGFGFEDPEELQTQIQDALQSGNDFSGVADGPVDINLPEGGTAVVRGNVRVSGSLISADELEYQDGSFTGVDGFHAIGGGFEAKSLERLELGETVLSNAEGVVFKDDTLSAGHVEGYRQGDIRLTLANGLSSKGKSFYVDGADLLANGDLTVIGVPKSTVTIDDGSVKLDLDEQSELTIRDGTGKDTYYRGSGGIHASTETPIVYKIENGSLTINGTGFAEVIETNSSARIETDEDGVTRTILNPKSNYFHIDPEQARDFVISVPEGGKKDYALCLRSPYISCDAIVDFPGRFLNLTGIIEYKRYPLKNGRVADLLTQQVYSGRDPGTIAHLNLDSLFTMVEELVVENTAPSVHGIIAFTNLGNYAVYELFDGTNVTRSGRFNAELKPDVVRRYRSFFGTQKPVIDITDETLVQYWEGSDVGIVTATCSRCRGADDALGGLRTSYASFENDSRWCGVHA